MLVRRKWVGRLSIPAGKAGAVVAIRRRPVGQALAAVRLGKGRRIPGQTLLRAWDAMVQQQVRKLFSQARAEAVVSLEFKPQSECK